MLKYLLAMLLLLPLATAESNILITINDDASVLEEFSLEIPADYDNFVFETSVQPLSVVYDGEYTIEDDRIVFEKPDSNIIEFSVLYDDIILRDGNINVFRSSFSIENPTTLVLRLPKGASVAPGTIPEPETGSDGERIMLEWSFVENPNIVVFYEQTSNNVAILFYILIITLIIIASVSFKVSKKVVKNVVEETLGSEELKVVGAIRDGLDKQKDIAKKLEFSKSKMSKVVRKLEEKDLILKEPYFKTYKLKLKKIR